MNLLSILAFLALFNCHPTAQIERVEHLSHPGAFVDGKVLLRADADEGVLIHELWHWHQEQKFGPVRGEEDRAWRERDAYLMELRWREYAG